MRNVSGPTGNTRTIGGSYPVRVQDVLPRFTEVYLNTDPGGMVSHDAEIYNSDGIDRLLRAGLIGEHLWANICYWSDRSTPGSPFFNPTWSDMGGGLNPASSVAVGLAAAKDNAAVFFQASGRECYAKPLVGGAWAANVAVCTATGNAAFAPINDNEVYVIDQIIGANVTCYQITYYNISGGFNISMPGYVYTTGSDRITADAARVNGIDYVYFTMDGQKRTGYVTRTGHWWSDIRQIVPLDIVDDTSQFRLSSVTGEYICGVLKRSYGMDMHVYIRGPENGTMGRELFIRGDNLSSDGKMFFGLPDYKGERWYVGPGIRWQAPEGGIVSLAPYNARMSASSNAPFDFSAQVPAAQDNPSLLRPGAEILFSVARNGAASDLNYFTIDAVTRPQDPSGKNLQITARSKAMRALSQWKSDACYDYWSQTKFSENPKDLAKMLRVSGTWNEQDMPGQPAGTKGISQEQLNVDGVMYTVAKACRGGEAKARFVPKSGDFKTRWGVGLAYYRETRAEAATRLGKKSADVEDDECGNNGIFALWGDTEHSGGVGIGLYHVHNNTWEKVTSVGLALARDTAHWLMIKFFEGNARVYYRADGAYAWVQQINYTITSATDQPWKRDQIGRASFYARPVTPYSKCYAFASDQDIIPVEDNSTFNPSDVVKVDEEHIHYNGKSANINIGDLNFRFGDLIASGVTPDPNQWVKFGGSRFWARLIQKVWPAAPQGTWQVRALKLYVKKSMSPRDGMNVGIWHWHEVEYDDNGAALRSWPIGELSGGFEIIPSDKITNDGGWVTVDFTHQIVSLKKDVGNWFILERADNPTHPNAAAYYQATHQGTGTGALFTWDEENDLWIDQAGNCAFELYAADRIKDNPNDDTATDDTTNDPNEWWSVYVQGAGLATANHAYIGQALVVEDGAMKGTCYKILDYVYRPGKFSIFCVDRDPVGMDESSKLRVAPTLYVDRDAQNALKRGYDNTLAAAHGTGRQVDTWREPPYIISDRMEYFSADPDYTLEDMVTILARKAGVTAVKGADLMAYSGNPASVAIPYANAKNFTMTVDYIGAGGVININARRTSVSSAGMLQNVVLDIANGQLGIYTHNGVIRDLINLENAFAGRLTVSFFDQDISIWINGRFVHTYHMSPEDLAEAGSWVTVTTSGVSAITIRIPEATQRIDNFILDAGRSGLQLMGELIGEKGFFYQDTQDGALRLFRARTTVNDPGSAYTLAVTEAETESDASLATRVRVEGTDVREKYDPELLIQYGNAFYQGNMYEINSAADADHCADLLLDEYGSHVVTKNFTGHADPRVEPNDQIYVSINGNSKRVIVDGVEFVYAVSETEAAFDMSINGRIPRSDLTF